MPRPAMSTCCCIRCKRLDTDVLGWVRFVITNRTNLSAMRAEPDSGSRDATSTGKETQGRVANRCHADHLGTTPWLSQGLHHVYPKRRLWSLLESSVSFHTLSWVVESLCLLRDSYHCEDLACRERIRSPPHLEPQGSPLLHNCTTVLEL